MQAVSRRGGRVQRGGWMEQSEDWEDADLKGCRKAVALLLSRYVRYSCRFAEQTHRAGYREHPHNEFSHQAPVRDCGNCHLAAQQSPARQLPGLSEGLFEQIKHVPPIVFPTVGNGCSLLPATIRRPCQTAVPGHCILRTEVSIWLN